MTLKRKRIYLALLGIFVFTGIYYYADYRQNLAQMELAKESALKISSGTFKNSLMDVLGRHRCFSPAEQIEVARAYAKLINLKRLRPTDKYFIVLSSANEFSHMYIRRGLKKYAVFKKEKGGFRAKIEKVKTFRKIKSSSGSIATSLWIDMAKRDVPAPVILDFSDIFSWAVDFLTEVRNGDRFFVAYEEETTGKGEVVSRRILAAEYDGAETGRRTAVFFKGNYYDGKGRSMRSLFLRAPLHYRRISSYFSYHRFHPILKYVRPHLGIDYAAPRGTPVSSVADGKVIYKGWKGGFGRYIAVKHSYGYVSTYGHLWRYAKGLRVGKRVRQGEVIGYVGMSGLATGPHLDFRIKHNGKYLNFLKIKYRPSRNLPRGSMKEFRKIYGKYFGK